MVLSTAIAMHETSHRSETPDDPTPWELPPTGDEIVTPSFSLFRVLSSVALAMALITPTLYYLGYKGYLGGQSSGVSFPHGSATRTAPAFDLVNATVPHSEIRSGGPPKDGIPAISSPKMISAEEADFLHPSDRVIGIRIGKEARAYPLAILNYHEIVNDKMGDQPFAVSYCPLCDSVSAFDRITSTGAREFGVSGLLYNSNVLMYDRDDDAESLWSQLKNESLAGKRVGQQLRLLPVELATWAEWRTRHPATKVMSTDTGHRRDYTRSPYGNYFSTDNLMFPVDQTDDRLPPKEKVLGILVDGVARAYPTSAFGEDNATLHEELNGKQFALEFNPETKSMRVADADDDVTWMYSLWFSWYAMHPETTTYSAD